MNRGLLALLLLQAAEGAAVFRGYSEADYLTGSGSWGSSGSGSDSLEAVSYPEAEVGDDGSWDWDSWGFDALASTSGSQEVVAEVSAASTESAGSQQSAGATAASAASASEATDAAGSSQQARS